MLLGAEGPPPCAVWRFEALLVLLAGHWPPRGLLSGTWPPVQRRTRDGAGCVCTSPAHP